MSRSPGYERTGSAASALFLALVLLLLLPPLSSCSKPGKTVPLPDQRQSAERRAAIAALDLQRSGLLRVEARPLEASPAAEAAAGRVRFRLQSPLSRVEDTDIRGYLDGRTKYDYNQGTSYHMRIGRRIEGPRGGEFELKRSLLRFELPRLPPGSPVEVAALSVYVEAFSFGSPLAEEGAPLPLHVYAYALDDDWGPGQGGVEGNSFSDAAPGEANWNESRAGEGPWPAPGALTPGARPLAVALLEGDERWLDFESEALRRFVEDCLREGRSLDLLLKLADDEEDRWGTEFALLTSEFGDERDLGSRRPRLLLEARLPAPSVLLEEAFVLEPGEERFYSLPLPGGGATLLSARLSPEAGGGIMPPALWVREGGSPASEGARHWVSLRSPLAVPWERAEIRLSAAPNAVVLGQTFDLKLKETWVSPGPREKQLPELLLRAPSGRLHRVEGRVLDEVHYGIDFAPDEPGLWRYGWSYLPREKSPPGSHQGEGLFYVSVPAEDLELLQAWASEIAAALEGREATGLSLQYRLNALVRRAARYGYSSEERREAAGQILEGAREGLPSRFRPDAD